MSLCTYVLKPMVGPATDQNGRVACQQLALKYINPSVNHAVQVNSLQRVKAKASPCSCSSSFLRQADSYDRALFETMGVKTIWLESFDDIPILLDEISSTPKKRP